MSATETPGIANDAGAHSLHRLVSAINREWCKRYGGESVSDIAALENRIVKIAEDRDCWLFNAQENQKEYMKLDARLRSNSCNDQGMP